MRLDEVRRVLAAIDDTTLSWHEAIGSAHTRLAPLVTHSGSAAEQPRVESLLARHGWELDEHSTHREALAGALASLAALGHPPSDALLDTYAEAADLISEHDVGSIQESDRAAAAEHAHAATNRSGEHLPSQRPMRWHAGVARGTSAVHPQLK